MRANLAALSITVLLGAAVCATQSSAQAPATSAQADYTAVNCANFMSDQKVPEDMRLISGEQSNYKITFAQGDYVYLNRGQDKGVRVGDRFQVVREQKDPVDVPWFKWQVKLLKAMGTAYFDAGQVRVVNVLPKTSIAQVSFSCAGFMQRGDIVRPYAERPTPALRDGTGFDHFAPVSGKPVAMLVTGTDYAQTLGTGSIVFVNLGAGQGVKIGDYFRIFRYQGSMAETAPQTKGYQYELYGYGSNKEHYTWKDLPREILGEGVVLNVSKNASTMLITYSTIEIYSGDYIEIE
jgi:hypothetical protein